MSVGGTTNATREHGAFRHEAFLYRTVGEYRDWLVPFIEAGVAVREPVLVAAPGEKLRLLRDALGGAAERVEMADMTEAGRNPARIIAGVLRSFADIHPDQRVRIIGEPIWPGRTGTEYPACVQHEALINTAFAGRNLAILCPYDVAGLDAPALGDALATHPAVVESGWRRASEHYDPGGALARCNQPLEAPPGGVSCSVTGIGELSRARSFASEHARRLGLDPGRIADLELIATELLTNSLVHTGGDCRLRLGRDGGHLVCAVEDTGHLADPLAGRRPSGPEQVGGRGLLLVNDLADLVRLHTGTGGTTVHAHLRLRSQ